VEFSNGNLSAHYGNKYSLAATKNRVAATKKSLDGNLNGNQCGNVAAAT